jgi:tetratricopeptide (TPR) repeat protein
MLFGILCLGIVGAGGWYLLKSRASAQQRELNQRFTAAITRADEYKARGQFSLALEQLNRLPPSAERETELVKLYRDKGNANLAQQPPDYQSAIQDYAAALRIQPPRTDIGILLGTAYYLLAREERETNRTASDNHLKQAREAFEVVLDRDPNSTTAWNYMAQIAALQADPILQRQCYKNIINIDPRSIDAQAAKRNLQSLGMKL